jgi:endonuclease-3
VLSAQCTDARVNIVTHELFKEAPDAATLHALPEERVRTLIRSINFFNNKTKSLKGLARILVERFDGRVPPNMDDLLGLPGVARKTANVVSGNAFDIASGIVVDTHVGRLSRRLGFSKSEDPAKVESDLTGIRPARTPGRPFA